MNHDITFKQLSIEESDQLHRWLQLDHVKDFWDDGDRLLQQVKERYFTNDNVKRYLFYIGREAVGYIQSYYIDPAHAYAVLTLPNLFSEGIDFFIGNEKYLNQGRAIGILKKFISSYCQEADRIIVDPEPVNHKAIHIYKKYGFIKVGEYQVQDKLHDIMAINLRRTSRGIILNSNKEVFLMQLQGGPTEDKRRQFSEPFWVTPGGKIEKNESAELALLRELREEVGITQCKEFCLLASGDHLLQWNNFPTRLIEFFYLVHLDDVFLHDKQLTQEESLLVKDYRWWSLQELEKTKEIIYPFCLANLLKECTSCSHSWVTKVIDLS